MVGGGGVDMSLGGIWNDGFGGRIGWSQRTYNADAKR